MNFDIASFFSGAGGLDLGFHQAGFRTVWANEFDKKIIPIFKLNFPKATVDERSITQVAPKDIPNAIGIIGGPPCQSWSEAGAKRGLNDDRGKVFLNYIEIIKAKEPLFFLAENVPGMLADRHAAAIRKLMSRFMELGYYFNYCLLNAKDYGVPQDRKRVIFVGYHKKLGGEFQFPSPSQESKTLRDVIWDLRSSAKPAKPKNRTNGSALLVSNHEYMTGDFSTLYMSRNRVRAWNEPSFTIQAGGRHASLHPQAPKMTKTNQDEQTFTKGQEHLYRRLSVREIARIQTFPDDFRFIYDNVIDGYKMIGSAVPVQFARRLAEKIMDDLKEYQIKGKIAAKPGTQKRIFAEV